ncbi:MAG: hypothetical protein HW391_415 [Chloroflexi bacterium]|nr:hypothetical protein [Chloroflexota bacterium]
MRGLVTRIGIVALVVVGGFILRPFITGNAGQLSVGDCFDPPASTVETVEDVQHHPCTDEHGAEVFFVGDYPGSKSDPYPTDDEMLAWLTEKCIPAAESYTGKASTLTPDLDIGWFQPTEDGWKGDDQGVICYLYRLDETMFKGSLKAG